MNFYFLCFKLTSVFEITTHIPVHTLEIHISLSTLIDVFEIHGRRYSFRHQAQASAKPKSKVRNIIAAIVDNPLGDKATGQANGQLKS